MLIHSDLKSIQQINLTGNLEKNTAVFFIAGRSKRNSFRFFKRKN